MLKELIAFEWRYHTRLPSFIAVAALFLILGFVLPATGFGPVNVAVTAPWLVMETMALVSLFSVFGVAIFVANAVVRDREYRFEEIVFTTPVRRAHFVAGRMGGALAAGVTSLAIVPIGMLLATRLATLDRARVGPIHIAAYVWPFVVIVIPTLLFVTALLFAIATLTRSALATYTASVFVYLLYMFAAAKTNSQLMAGSRPGTTGGGSVAALLDPFALSTFFEVTRYWTAAQKNQAFVGLTGALLVNRVLWIAIAVAIGAFAVARTSFRTAARSKRGLKSAPHEGAAIAISARYVRCEPAAQTLGVSVRAWWSATALEVRSALRSRPFLFLLALWFVLAFVEIRSDVFSVEYGASLYPATQLIFQSLLQPLSIIGMIIVIYYGSELFWREQQLRIAPIIDATPVRGAVMALAKWSALVALIAALIAVGIVAGVVSQLTSGYSALQPALYLSLFYFAGLPLALYAAAAVAIHALSPGKYAGLALVLLFIIGTRNAPMIGLEHPLWQFGSGPSVPYSAMYGFGAASSTFGALMLVWSAVAVCMLAVAGILWRGLRDRVRDRFRFHGERVAARVAVAALVVGAGGWWLVAGGTGNGLLSPPSTIHRPPALSRTALLDWKEQYERRYRSLAALPQPHVIALRTVGDFFPAERRGHFSGDYTLRNDTAAPLRTIVVSVPRDVDANAISIGGAHVTADTPFGMYRFDLASPLLPNAQTTLHFDIDTPIDENGAIVMSFATFPALGYRAASELSDPRERARRGLGKSSMPEGEDTEVVDTSESQRVAFDATLSTSEDQTAITTGRLERQWSAGGRHCFHYRGDAPVRNRFAFISGRYAIKTVQADGVDVSIAYHPQHSANVAAMLTTAAQTLDYCNRAFATYPHHQLKLVEAPASWNFGGYALPDTILFSETRTFLVDARDPNRPDLLTRRVAHEVAHQWWGYQLIPANRAGATTLTESLAKYTELVMLERLRGAGQVRILLDIERDRYLAGRSRDEQPERTLANAGDQQYLYYSKGALVFHALRDLIGEPALNSALRRLIEQGGAPTTADLLRQLRAVSSDAQYAQIDRWFNETGEVGR